MIAASGRRAESGRVAAALRRAENCGVALAPHRDEAAVIDPPAVRGAHQRVLVAPADDEIVTVFDTTTHVLSLQVAPACRRVAVDGDLVVGDHVLAVVERFQRLGDAGLDRLDAAQRRRSEFGGDIGREDVVEFVPRVTIECPAVGDRQIGDRGAIGEVDVRAHRQVLS